MQENKNYNDLSAFKRLFFSPTLYNKNKTQQITYVALTTAFVVIANMFFEFKFLEVQFSLTLAVCALAGVIMGAGFGFVSAFLGDLVGFLFNSAGMIYMPWVGISMGVVALISGVVVNGIKNEKFNLYLRIILVAILTLIICTIAINTTAFWVFYSNGKTDYFTYLFTRLILKGQIINSLVNYAILFITIPVFKRINLIK
ncbi:MAG: ECF transporter S component [Clostridia bacterium]|nr:ECF transporter S component [Clostridia bacterium]